MKLMKRAQKSRDALAVIAVLAVTAMPLAAAGQADAATSPVTVADPLLGQKLYPESLTADPATGDIYVSGFGDGAVLRIPAGSHQPQTFLPGGTDGRTAATGVKVWHDELWVADFSGLNVYQLRTKQRLAHFAAPFAAAEVNDIALTEDGTGYITDSLNPVVYRVTQADLLRAGQHHGRGAAPDAQLPIGEELTGTAAAYTQNTSPNLNGIVLDGRYLVTVNFTSGQLFRIDTATGEVREIAVDGPALVNGDGLFLRGHTLYVARNKANAVSKVELSDHALEARVVRNLNSPDFEVPTSIIVYHGRVLITRSQFDKGGPFGPGTPELPFSVAAVQGL